MQMLLMIVPLAGLGTWQTPDDQIRAVLARQVEAWNRADIGGFMAHYWQSEQLTFSSGGRTRRGWQTTRDHYRRSYDTPAKMGRLTFSELEVQLLAPGAALVLGRWKLEREDDAPAGNFSLVMKRVEGQWVIVHDHTSVLEE